MKTKEEITNALFTAEQNHLNFIISLREGRYDDMSTDQLRENLLAKLNVIETLKWVLK